MEALNLISLAKAAGGGSKAVPGTAFKVRVVEKGAEVFYHDQYCPIIRDDGHFGDHDQPYGSFELLDKLID
jgi:hypothetical protein